VSVRPLAEAVHRAGFAIELPRLPGHGTTVDDMIPTRWADWSGEAEAAYQRLALRADKVVVAGLSMGGTLTTWLACRHPEIAGIVCINAAVEAPPTELVDLLRAAADAGQEIIPSIGNDIAKEGVSEASYDATPVAPLLSLSETLHVLVDDLARIRCPVLIATSLQDHVVAPASSDTLAAKVSGPVERLTLERSYHVATLDHDAELINERAVEFATRVTTA
jgi:carboxylesterase